MSKTRLYVLGFLWLATLATTLQGGESVLVLTGAGGSSTQIPVFSANPFQAQTTLSGVAAGAFQVLTTPDGQKNYIISNSGATGISVYDQNFNNGSLLSGAITLAPTAAALSPDGKRLIVIAGNVYIFDTATGNLLTPSGLQPQGNATDLAFSIDSSKAYILSNSGSTGSVTPIDLVNNNTLGTALTLPGAGTGIALAPNGFLYVTTQNRLFEINAKTLALTPAGTISVNATPSKVVFTPDGKYALAVNRTPITGSSVILFDLAQHTVIGTFPNFAVTLDKLFVIGNAKVLAYSSQVNQLYDVSVSTGLNVTPSVLQSAIPTNVTSIALSNEIPARSLYAIATANGTTMLYKVDLSSNQAIGQFSITAAPGQLVAYANANPTSGGTSITGYNTGQVVQAGAVSVPLVARVQDSLGRPVFGARVDFTTAATGVTISAVSAFTNSDGYAQTYVTAPATPGAFEVDAVSPGTQGAAYTLTVPGGTTGGGGTGGGGTPVAAIKIAGGNGQILLEQSFTTQPLAVLVTDTSGNPTSGVPVHFAITQGHGTIQGNPDVTTDQNGVASVGLTSTSINAGNSYEQATITATSSVGSVNFTLTTVIRRDSNGNNAAPPIVALQKPDSDPVSFQRIVRGGAGTIAVDAIRVQVVLAAGPQAGQVIPNVALNVSPQDPNSPGGTCANNPMTDAKGIASCDLLFNNILGIGQLNVNVGGSVNTAQVLAQVTVGPPTTIAKSSGDNQSAKPGTVLPQPLRVRITDASNNPLQNVVLTWAVTKGTATLSSISTTTDANGLGSANLTLGANPGIVNVKVTAGTATNAPSATFTETVTVLVGGLVVVSGDNQTVNSGLPFGQLVVQVNDASGLGLAGVPVSFAVTSGTASLSATSVTSDSSGRATVTVTAGSNPGTVLVNATAGGQSQTFTLTVRQAGPPITATGFVNAASGATGLTPCGIALAQAIGLVPSLTSVLTATPPVGPSGPLPTLFQGVDLTVNGIAAPIYYVGPNAVAFQTPCETQPGLATVVMRVNGGTTTISGVTVSALQPGIFETTFPATGTSKKYAVLIRPDGSYVTPDNPAHRGEQIKMFATGLGQVSIPTGTGKAGVGGQTVNATALVGVNNGGVRLISTEYMNGEIGLYIVTFEIPADTQTGTYQPLALVVAGTDGNSVFSNPSYLPIQ